MSSAKYVTPANSNGDKGISTLSKKRYMEIQERVSNVIGDGRMAEAVMKEMCEVLKFDPSVSRYDKDQREKLLENKRKWRQKKKANSAQNPEASQNPEGEAAGACT